MKDLKTKAAAYLGSLDERAGPFVPHAAPSLPLHLRERFALFSVRVFGRSWLLAVEQDGWDAGTPTEYRQHWIQLQGASGGDNVALVLSGINANVRNRMIALGVPFVVPDTQIFLPASITLLTESSGDRASRVGKPLSPPAQALILMQVQQGGLEDLSSKELSSRLGYSRPSVSNATAELEQHDLCQTYRKGKEQLIRFVGDSRTLWDAALPLLRSPVAKTLFVNWNNPLEGAKCAGISALANRSALSEDPLPVFAVSEKNARAGLEQGLIKGCIDRYEADVELEVWRYNPSILADGSDVDPLSLYLSLRKIPDERVQAELADMMEALFL